ncbi:hypothetical protein MSG28_012428 [Choristoneura fumiferana]|uniref:Uncharacterized protein n=1 Tax=Choristoneura fumiferana TaxID=7141 RepID=A0ACC0KDD5_CHOFU|nr:hypothetical protein MSG28_012428 [Choristoneura fumiferana]
MSEQTQINYVDGEIVWVKLGSCWWPGEVVNPEKLPPDVLPSFKKPPIAVVKFFQENTYEYVKNNNSIFKYNCSRKNEFIKKGLYNYRSKQAHMEKFPEDVVQAETETGGDPDILTSEEFTATPKKSYAGIFGSASKKTTPVSGRGRRKDSSSTPRNSSPVRRVINREKSDYKVHILVQGTKTPSQATDTLSTPSTSRAGSESEAAEDRTPKADKPLTTFSSPNTSGSISGVYPCPLCAFTTTRLNVLILHNKTHSATYTPYTPSPVRKKPVVKSPQKSITNKSPKARKPRKEKIEKTEKVDKTDKTEKIEKTESPKNTTKIENADVNKKSQTRKRSIEEEQKTTEVKKIKTDEEIKSSLLADWDDMDEDSNDKSPEVAPASPLLPAQPTPAELPVQVSPADPTALSQYPTADKSDTATEKPESSSDSKYEFCEDEDWSLEADAGRKIPRVKNPAKRREERKSISIDDDDVAREVAELLNRTTMPDLPAAPEPLTVEENFPEPSIVKSPDKKIECVPESSKLPEKLVPEPQPTKAIFKTKTFFRSRHSRSQDAIGKYVAEQLNAAERMDAETELNGSDNVSSPEARESPPIEHVKVARLAPKIQLKKMKAEAAQSWEKEKSYLELVAEDNSTANGANNKSDSLVIKNIAVVDEKENCKLMTPHSNLDVLYPTQEIKPINKDIQHGPLTKDKNQQIEHEQLGSTFIKEDIIYERVIIDKSDDKNVVKDSDLHIMPESIPPKPSEQFIEPFMNESTASAVDALLSVSRETDRVTKIISDDPPEDLFEDDNIKDNVGTNNINGFNEELKKENDLLETMPAEDKPTIKEPVVEAVPTVEEITKVQDVSALEETPILEEIAIEKDIPKMEEEPISEEGRPVGGSPNTEEIPLTEDIPVMDEVPPLAEKLIASEHKDDIKYQQINFQESSDLKHKYNFDSSEVPLTRSDRELNPEVVVDNIPSESDLQIAEALINLPATAIQNIVPSHHQENLNLATHFTSEHFQEEVQEEIIQTENNIQVNEVKMSEAITEDKSMIEPNIEESLETTKSDSLNARYETEEEKSENLNAAQSLVEMSESIDHKIKVTESKVNEIDSISTHTSTSKETSNTPLSKVIETNRSVEQKIASLSSDNNSDPTNSKLAKFETSSSKLLKILEEPCMPKIITKTTPTKQVIVSGKEKILNFDVSKAAIKVKPQSPKQKIIIRRNTPSKNIMNSLNDMGAQENIILSRSNKPQGDGSAVQTYTIQASAGAPPDAGAIVIQQKIRNNTKTAPKLHKLKQQFSLVTSANESKQASEQQTTDDTIYDINSMPIVLSDDILTPENIEKMPIVMSDGKIITNPVNPPKLVKTKHVESEKIVMTSQSKPELKTLLMNPPTTEVSKATTPNILSKSAKLRGSKPMLVIDKATGKQKIIMTKSEPAVKEIKQAPSKLEPVTQTTAKPGKFIIVPTASSPRPARAQKIVIDPQTGKAHVLVAKPEPPPDNKPVSAKLVPQPDAPPGNTVMIITNAQGAQSRILLTPEHEKILFPNKQQPKVSQLKTVTHRLTAGSPGAPKTIVTTVGPTKTANTKMVPKQKSAIITSKGQLIVGGRVATTAQNIAPMPEIRPKQRIIASEPRKLAQTVQKTSSEPLIFLQQKSGQVMQLTTAQFEHLQRTGQIVQKTSAVPENKIVLQKSIAMPPNESVAPTVPKKMRRPPASSPQPAKRAKQDINIAPALTPAPVPAHAPLSGLAPAPVAPPPLPALAPLASTPTAVAPAPYPDLENFEELLPSTAIVRQPEPAPAPEPAAPPAPLADGQLLAVPGEHFGGPPGTFYLCVEDNGTLTPIDNRPLVLENNQLVPMAEPAAPERRDILEAALANSDVFHEPPPEPAFRDLNANVSVHCRVSETSSTLHQPIMTPVEVPSLADAEPPLAGSLEAGLAVIGVAPPSVPTSLELPITVTDPRIAPRAAPRRRRRARARAPSPAPAPASMPLLLDEPAGKSMPLLTDELTPAWRAPPPPPPDLAGTTTS